MNNDDRIVKILENINNRLGGIEAGQEELKQGQHGLEKRADNNDQGQSRLITAMEALKAGQDDIRVTMATKQDLESVKKELQETLATKADLIDLGAKIAKQQKEQNTRLDELERTTGTHNPHKN